MSTFFLGARLRSVELRSSFCAICVDPIAGTPLREPLGKRGAMVNVCSDCSTLAAPVRLGPERGYPVPAERERIAQRAPASPGRLVPVLLESHRVRTPGMILVRIPQRDATGKHLDFVEAQKTIAHELWYPHRRYLGTDGRSFMFERPDPKVAAASRRRDVDPTAAIAKHRRAR